MLSHDILILLISSIIPFATLIYTVVGLKHKAEVDYVGRLEKRLEECERIRDELLGRIKELEDMLELHMSRNSRRRKR
jgi:hypothetical protein